ncbi:hypothetical protein SCLCIDRAFT_1206590 [Scleroderma citrinum Foug A]|uniref:Uncharacterized protein n=1 Tax=Scleroderma citrinum Foug A TaxID=1036808 RepID=A0A0C3AZN3_9AGAM|nr:hypothetical protein SCLCIDRAFT_1206590 [Scleroderma citrinum Foug A]
MQIPRNRLEKWHRQPRPPRIHRRRCSTSYHVVLPSTPVFAQQISVTPSAPF